MPQTAGGQAGAAAAAEAANAAFAEAALAGTGAPEDPWALPTVDHGPPSADASAAPPYIFFDDGASADNYSYDYYDPVTGASVLVSSPSGASTPARSPSSASEDSYYHGRASSRDAAVPFDPQLLHPKTALRGSRTWGARSQNAWRRDACATS